MGTGPPLADLPEWVTLDLAEVAEVLFAIDIAVAQTDPATPEHVAARRAQRLMTTRLWPELGELLDESDGEEEYRVDVPHDTLLTVPEVATRLGLPGGEVYQLIFSGQLAGEPRPDGAVYVDSAAVDAFEAQRQAQRWGTRPL